MFLTPAIAKAHLRIIGDDEAVDLALKSTAAELAVTGMLDRAVFVDQAALTAAIAAAPAALAAASVAWLAADALAELIESNDLRLAEKKQALDVYNRAAFAGARNRRGVVINSLILSEMLLALEDLYERRPYAPTGLLDTLRVYV